MQQSLSTVEIRFEDSIKVIRSMTNRVMRRLQAAGAHSIQKDDVVSELSVAWCIAKKRYDPAHGVPFHAYLTNGMYQHINRWLESEVPATYAVCIDASSDEDSKNLSEVLADETIETPDISIIRQQSFERFVSKLKPRAKQFLLFLRDPPMELLETMNAMTERARYGRERGFASISPQHITSCMIFDLMGASRLERGQIMREIKQRLERLNFGCQ